MAATHITRPTTEVRRSRIHIPCIRLQCVQDHTEISSLCRLAPVRPRTSLVGLHREWSRKVAYPLDMFFRGPFLWIDT